VAGIAASSIERNLEKRKKKIDGDNDKVKNTIAGIEMQLQRNGLDPNPNVDPNPNPNSIPNLNPNSIPNPNPNSNLDWRNAHSVIGGEAGAFAGDGTQADEET